MKATIRKTYGGPDQISVEEIDIPEINDNEVLIKVHATTVNRTDCANLTAKPFIMRFILGFSKPRKVILGTDFAGEIGELGKAITKFRKSDKVFGFTDIGSESQAEYMKANSKNVFPIPKGIDFKVAAASLEGAHYAYTFIHKVNIESGQKVLINGATGAIGSALLQFVRQYDVQITATCNTKNIANIKSLGADKIIDYTKEDFTKDTEAYDYVFDAVGKSTFGKCKSLLKKKGVYISSELGPYSQNIFYAITSFMRKKKVIFPIPYDKQKTIPYTSRLLESGTFKPLIEREFSLGNIAKAYEYVLTGEKIGNVVVRANSNPKAK